MKHDPNSYVLIYEETAHARPVLGGIWRGSYPLDGSESIGLLVRQGLAGFSERATWNDLAAQLESSGFVCADIAVEEVMRIGQDVVRVVFLASGQIRCQWLTHGPDDNVGSADEPAAVFPARPNRDGN